MEYISLGCQTHGEGQFWCQSKCTDYEIYQTKQTIKMVYSSKASMSQ